MVMSGNVMFVSIPHVLCDIVVMQITVNQWCELRSLGCSSGQRAFQERGGRLNFNCQHTCIQNRRWQITAARTQSFNWSAHSNCAQDLKKLNKNKKMVKKWPGSAELQNLPFGTKIHQCYEELVKFLLLSQPVIARLWGVLLVVVAHFLVTSGGLLVDSLGAMLDKNNMSMFDRLQLPVTYPLSLKTLLEFNVFWSDSSGNCWIIIPCSLLWAPPFFRSLELRVAGWSCFMHACECFRQATRSLCLCTSLFGPLEVLRPSHPTQVGWQLWCLPCLPGQKLLLNALAISGVFAVYEFWGSPSKSERTRRCSSHRFLDCLALVWTRQSRRMLIRLWTWPSSYPCQAW